MTWMRASPTQRCSASEEEVILTAVRNSGPVFVLQACAKIFHSCSVIEALRM
jgi:hypothetical protein